MLDKFKLTIVTYVAMVVLAVTSILYTTIAQQHTEQKFCNVINTVVDAYKDNPEPTSDLGKKLKEEYFSLQGELGCTSQEN